MLNLKKLKKTKKNFKKLFTNQKSCVILLMKLKKEGILMKLITTVAGIIYNEKGEILCTKRDQGKYDYVSLKWEFPGGKMEANETEIQTLARELREELEIEVEIGDKYYQVEHDYPDFHLSMAVYVCKMISKQFKMNVHKDIEWLKPQDMLKLDWAKADLPVAEKIYNNSK